MWNLIADLAQRLALRRRDAAEDAIRRHQPERARRMVDAADRWSDLQAWADGLGAPPPAVELAAALLIVTLLAAAVVAVAPYTTP